jgi:uncharacterized membrane protein
VAVAGIAVATVVGLVVLWPGDAEAPLNEGLTADTESAEVTAVELAPCPPPQTGDCADASVRLEDGADAGDEVTIPLGESGLAPELSVGDEIRVAQPATAAPEAGGAATPAPQASYTFVDFERRSPMLWLGLGFAALVVVFGRLRGALSLLGLGLSLGVILVFVVPAILDGSSPLAVALVGSVAVMLITITLAHGLGPKSLAAMLGTTASLALVAALGLAFTDLTHLTGLASEEATALLRSGTGISFDGLLLAGMVIGALGVLDDVTVSQASTVMALRAANPRQRFGALYRRALRVGRDHVSATVNTLVLAYAGASLPVLLIFSSSELGLVDAVNFELVAKEVVAMLVGSIGLIAAVPVTTALAALLSGDPHPAQRQPHRPVRREPAA